MEKSSPTRLRISSLTRNSSRRASKSIPPVPPPPAALSLPVRRLPAEYFSNPSTLHQPDSRRAPFSVSCSDIPGLSIDAPPSPPVSPTTASFALPRVRAPVDLLPTPETTPPQTRIALNVEDDDSCGPYVCPTEWNTSPQKMHTNQVAEDFVSAYSPRSTLINPPEVDWKEDASDAGFEGGRERKHSNARSLFTPKKKRFESIHVPESPFNVKALPNPENLAIAMRCPLLDESGNEVLLGDLIDREHKTIALFVRHFWCGLCQTYLEHLAAIINDEEMKAKIDATQVKVLIIGNGHWSMLAKYRKIFRCVYPVYTDPTSNNDLFRALGMTRRTNDMGSAADKGDYLAETSVAKSIVKGTVNGLRMPIRSPGDMKQLGGEFVFEPVKPKRIARKPSAPPQPTPPTSSGGLNTPNSFQWPLQSTYPLLPDPIAAAWKLTASTRKPSSVSVTLSRIPGGSMFVGRHLSVSDGGYSEAGDTRSWSFKDVKVPFNSLGLSGSSSGRQAATVEIKLRFVHRMSSTRNHASLFDVFAAAGVKLRSEPAIQYTRRPSAPDIKRKPSFSSRVGLRTI